MAQPSEQELIAALRQIAHAIDYGRAPARLAPGIAGVLMKRELIVPTGLVGFRLTNKGRELLRGIR